MGAKVQQRPFTHSQLLKSGTHVTRLHITAKTRSRLVRHSNSDARSMYRLRSEKDRVHSVSNACFCSVEHMLRAHMVLASVDYCTWIASGLPCLGATPNPKLACGE